MPSRAASLPKESAPLFSALGDPTRLALVAHLSIAGPTSIAGLTAPLDVTRQAVTKHLAVLESARFVRGLSRGGERVWAVETRRREEAQRCLDLISRRWDSALERLRAAVEDDDA
jgi:DNA-binding transcriptional ArsR family regulator